MAPRDHRLVPTAITNTKVLLTWDDFVGGEDEYHIHQWLGNNPIAIVDKDASSFLVTGLDPETNYSFTIGAHNTFGDKFNSQWEAVRTDAPPDGLKNLTLTATTTQVDLTWDDVAGEDFYDVYQWDPAGSILLATLDPDVTSYPVNNLLPNTQYHFSIAARNSFGQNFNDQPSGWQMTITAPSVAIVGNDAELILTSDTTPAISGTVDDMAASIEVTVGGNAYAATNNGDGTWSLADNTISPALAIGLYEVVVTATNPFGSVGTDTTSNELSVHSPLISDLTHNGYVDLDDLTILLANWNTGTTVFEGNIAATSSTTVDFGDYTILLSQWTGPGGNQALTFEMESFSLALESAARNSGLAARPVTGSERANVLIKLKEAAVDLAMSEQVSDWSVFKGLLSQWLRKP